MDRMLHFMKKIVNREIMLYLLFGVLTTIVNYGIFILGVNIAGISEALIVNLCAFVVATLFAFVTNRLFVFRKKSFYTKIIIKEMIQFFLARIFSLGVEQLGLLLAIKYLNIEQNIVGGISSIYIWKIVLSFIAVLLNYFASKYIVFRKRDEKE